MLRSSRSLRRIAEHRDRVVPQPAVGATLGRRALFAGAAGLVALAGAGRVRAASTGPDQNPVRIGCITSLGGPQDVLGRSILNGAQIAADQVNAKGGVGGRPLQIVAGDDHGNPERAVQLAQEMRRDGVNLFCGCLTSNVALAVTATLPAFDAVLISCSAQSDTLTHEAFNPHFFRVTDQVTMRSQAQARLMAQRHPDVTRWGAILPDSEHGRAAWTAFRDGLLDGCPAPDLQAPVLARLGERDFTAQVMALRQGGCDGLFVGIYGEDATAFYQQAQRAGLFTGIRVVTDSFNEFLTPLALGGACPENLWLGIAWYHGGYRHLEASRNLYDAYMLRTGNSLPSGLVGAGHAAVHAYAKAIAVAGRIGTGAVITSLSGMTVETAMGPVTFRAEDHQAVCDVNFVRLKASMPTGLDILDCARPEIEVAEFVRTDGASVIEPPSPGRRVARHA